MTLEQEIDYNALSLITQDKKYSNSELVALFSNILTPTKAADLHKKFVENEYYKQAVSGIPDYVIHERALFYLTFLQKEKDKEDLDYKLKQITLSSVRWNKYFPTIAVGVALLSVAVPVIIKSCEKDKIVTYKLQTEQLQLLIKDREKNTKPVQETYPSMDIDSSVSP